MYDELKTPIESLKSVCSVLIRLSSMLKILAEQDPSRLLSTMLDQEYIFAKKITDEFFMVWKCYGADNVKVRETSTCHADLPISYSLINRTYEGFLTESGRIQDFSSKVHCNFTESRYFDLGDRIVSFSAGFQPIKVATENAIPIDCPYLWYLM